MTRKRKYLAGLFAHNYIDSKVMFVWAFNQLPSIKVIHDIDGTAAYAFISKNYSSEIVRVYQSSTYHHAERESLFNMTIIELKGNRMIEVGHNYAEILHTHTHFNWANTVIEELASFYLEKNGGQNGVPTVLGFARAIEMN